MAPSKLSEADVALRLNTLAKWSLADGALHRELTFPDFAAAFAFMTRVALIAEKADHHPDWSNVYNRVTIDLRSHDVGGISERDFAMARKIDAALDD